MPMLPQPSAVPDDDKVVLLLPPPPASVHAAAAPAAPAGCSTLQLPTPIAVEVKVIAVID